MTSSLERRAALGVASAAVLFGSTFAVMKGSVERASPSAFLATRFLIGGAVVCAYATSRRGRRRPPRGVLVPAVACGLALSVGYALQTVGLQYTTSSTSAFITYLLVIFVAIFGTLLHRQLPPALVTAGLVLAMVGMWLLTAANAGFGRGELLTFGCAIAYALHILLLDRFSPRFDTAWLTGLQLIVVGLVCLGPGFAQGGYAFGASAWLGAAFTGVGASAIAFTLQVAGQRRLGPTRTALLLMIEPVTAAIVGYLLGERLGVRGALGAALILLGIGLAESKAGQPGDPDAPGMRETPMIPRHSGVSADPI